jgi:hypothetical protein
VTARFIQRLGAAAGVVYAILLMTAGAFGSPTTQPAFAIGSSRLHLVPLFPGEPVECDAPGRGRWWSAVTNSLRSRLDVDHDQAGERRPSTSRSQQLRRTRPPM